MIMNRSSHFSFIKLIITAVLLLGIGLAKAVADPIVRVEPPNWWAGLSQSQLELMVYGPNIARSSVKIEYPGLRFVSQTSLDNPNYVFLTLELDPQLSPGTVDIQFTIDGSTHIYPYPILQREANPTRHQGFSASDVIYLMMPDRFANGDPKNDSIDGMLEAANRSIDRARHGGDFKGVMDRLPYLDDLGVTAIWFTPVFENDMPFSYGAYHGYAATDMYKVDRRFGSNQEYKALVDSAHAMGLKVIMDMIHNHVGDQHWWIKDLPSEDWLNDFETFGITNYRAETISDPYVSIYDFNKMTKGWFVKEMPDLNQKNPWLARYLIQNTIWWIEYSGIDGIRMDTYPYPDKDYMAEWVKTILDEFPSFNIVGEAWVPHIAMEAYWQRGFNGKDGYESHLPSVTDFQVHHTMRKALNEEFGWSSGVSAMYHLMAQDFLYSDPMLNVVFLDNHDTERYLSLVGEDRSKLKMALAFLLTMRGIPQVYYGTEILMSGFKDPGDANVRKDFPGGWPGDPRDAFTAKGRTAAENDMFQFTRSLMQWRRTSTPIHNGKLMHFIPDDNTYVYFRYNDEGTVMVVVNASKESKNLSLARFNERLEGFRTWKNPVNAQTGVLGETLSVPGMTTLILDLQK
jgi:glycosidase